MNMDVGRLSPPLVEVLVGDLVIAVLGLGLEEDKFGDGDGEVQPDVDRFATVLGGVLKSNADPCEACFFGALVVGELCSDGDVEAVCVRHDVLLCFYGGHKADRAKGQCKPKCGGSTQWKPYFCLGKRS